LWGRTSVDHNTTDICAELYKTPGIIGWIVLVEQAQIKLNDSAEDIMSPATLVELLM
jgi:hypothetical protein